MMTSNLADQVFSKTMPQSTSRGCDIQYTMRWLVQLPGCSYTGISSPQLYLRKSSYPFQGIWNHYLTWLSWKADLAIFWIGGGNLPPVNPTVPEIPAAPQVTGASEGDSNIIKKALELALRDQLRVI